MVLVCLPKILNTTSLFSSVAGLTDGGIFERWCLTEDNLAVESIAHRRESCRSPGTRQVSTRMSHKSEHPACS